MQCSGSTGGVDTCAAMTPDTGTNRLTAIGTQTPTYDAAGNMTSDGTGVGSHSYTWDGENRLTSATDQVSGTTTSAYDALGERIRAANPGWTNEYAFGAGGEPLGTYDPVQGAWGIYQAEAGGRAVWLGGSSARYFFHASALGSTTMVTDQAGGIVQDQEFYPWGQAGQSAGGAGWYQFAGFDSHPVDGARNLEVTPARLYDPSLGRWLSPDPMGGDVTNPQSLNRYAYVMNNPTTFTDPLGLCAKTGEPGPCNGSGSRAGNPPDVAALAQACFSAGLFPSGTGCGGPLESSELALPEAAWANTMNVNFLSQSSLSHNGSWSLGGTTYNWVAGVISEAQPGGYGGASFDISAVTGHWGVAGGEWCSSSSCLSVLSGLGNFSSGAGDALSLTGTYWIRRWRGTESVVNENSFAYSSGAATGIAIGAGIGEELANSPNYLKIKIALHEAHHYFPLLGSWLAHIQMTIWRAGVPDSDTNIHVPLPWGD